MKKYRVFVTLSILGLFLLPLPSFTQGVWQADTSPKAKALQSDPGTQAGFQRFQSQAAQGPSGPSTNPSQVRANQQRYQQAVDSAVAIQKKMSETRANIIRNY